MTVVYGLLMGWIASLVYKEAKAALQAPSMGAAPAAMAPPVANRLRTVNLQPLISLPSFRSRGHLLVGGAGSRVLPAACSPVCWG